MSAAINLDPETLDKWQKLLAKQGDKAYACFGKQLRECIIAESKSYTLFRSAERSKAHGEVFTPSWLVCDMLADLPREVWVEGETFCDPSCGNGQFLAAVVIAKYWCGHKRPLETIYGVDILEDNVAECKQRLRRLAFFNYPDMSEVDDILNRNIVCHDALTYHYRFDGT